VTLQEAPSLRVGSVADPQKHPCPHLYYHAKFGDSRSNHYEYPPEKKIDGLVLPFRVTRGHCNRRGRIDQLPITSYWWSIVIMNLSRTVSEINGDFGRKSQMFPTPVYLSPLKELHLEFCNGGSAQKTNPCPYQSMERVYMTIFAFVYIYQSVRDRRTDRRTGLLKQYRALYATHADAR